MIDVRRHKADPIDTSAICPLSEAERTLPQVNRWLEVCYPFGRKHVLERMFDSLADDC
jgi:hypothetical protein